ncbi:MAG TPA: hypothetical protein PLT66_01855 [Bacillota bacterium]|nr:hypothetical protein [Bacillota bacterium]
MNKRETVTRIIELLRKPLNDAGFVLWYVDMYKDRDGQQLLIEIDAEGGVNMEKCTAANEIVNEILDAADIIDDQYTLEVSSAGLTRELKNEFQLRYYLGTDTPVTVRLYAPVDGRKQIDGTLDDLDERTLTIGSGGEEVCIERRQIASVKVELE